MNETTDTQFHGITVTYKEQLVKITTDKALLDYLAEPEIGSGTLAEAIRMRYAELYNRELEISRESLAVEILIHCYLDVFMHRTETFSRVLPKKIETMFIRLLHSLEARTEIIDCGEREIDSNRIIFDAMSPFYKILCSILGNRA